MSTSWIAFMAVLPHSLSQEIVEKLTSYPSTEGYIIAMETAQGSHSETNGEHFHFVVQMSPDDYNKLCNTFFKNKHKLRGRALKDKPRQYGRVKNIQDLDKMMAYTCKDANIISNLTDEQLDKYINMSFKKQVDRNLEDDIIEFIQKDIERDIDNQIRRDPTTCWSEIIFPDKRDIYFRIIDYCIEKNELIPTKFRIITIAQRIMKTTKNPLTDLGSKLLYGHNDILDIIFDPCRF